MPINQEVEGDLIELAKAGEFDVIVHGCNCQGKMGSGIAPKINSAFDRVLEADHDFHVPVGDVRRLGQFSVAYQSSGLYVVNAYTQFTFTGRRSGKIDVDYPAIRNVFSRLNVLAIAKVINDRMGIPLIGAGLAGGDWEKISEIINDCTPDLNITLVRFV